MDEITSDLLNRHDVGDNATWSVEYKPALRFELWDIEECARQLRVQVSTIRTMGKKGPPRVRLGGRVYFRPESVEAWLKSRETVRASDM